MAVITHEDVNPTLLANTTMQKRLFDGVAKQYLITPNDGYVLHDNRYDVPVFDEITGEETGEVILGYRTSTASCTIAQFNANTYEFYAVPIDEVPENQIYGNGNNTEVM